MTNLNDQLKPLRDEIDALDTQLLALLNKRGRVSLEVGKLKRAADPNMGNIRNRQREIDIIERITKGNQGPFSNQQLANIFELIFEEHRNLQQGLKND